MQTFTDTKTWLLHHGFNSHPFEYVNAENEPDLYTYFERFPFFEEIEKTKCSFLFLKRGAGKSANRMMLAKRYEKSLKTEEKKLAVPYTDFSRLIKKEQVTLTDHIREILAEAVPLLYDLCIQNTDLGKNLLKLSEEYQKDLTWFIARYSQRLHKRAIEQQIIKIDEVDEEEKKNFLKKLVDIADQTVKSISDVHPVFQIISSFLNIKENKPDDLPDIEHSPLDLMSRFAEIAEKLGIKHIYILIDRIDEYAQICEYDKAANILKSLIETIPLLELPRYAFKFFLPLEIQKKLSSHIRSDRFDVHEYIWKSEELEKMFENRLAAYCGEKKDQKEEENLGRDEKNYRSFERLFKDKEQIVKDKKVIDEMIQFSNKSPRKLLKLAKIIFDEHTRTSPIQKLISKETYEQAVSVFAQQQIKWRSLNEPAIAELGKLTLDKERPYISHFNIMDVAHSLNIPKSEARDTVKKWEDAGLVEAYYKILDQSLTRYLYAKKENK